MNPHHGKLINYVNAATDLAESLKQDLKDGREISDESISYLSKFYKAAQEASKMLDLVEAVSGKDQLN